MKINLISKEDHRKLLAAYTDFPSLTLQNTGYQYIRKESLNDEENTKVREIEAILKNTIEGFSSFSNFRLNIHDELQLRLQYNYNHDNGGAFTGVGYVLLDELLNGFKEDEREDKM